MALMQFGSYTKRQHNLIFKQPHPHPGGADEGAGKAETAEPDVYTAVPASASVRKGKALAEGPVRISHRIQQRRRVWC